MAKNDMRKDYITDERVIISAIRGKRPHCFEKPKVAKTSKECPFCPENERKTKEIESIKDGDKWVARSVKNIFPIVDQVNWVKSSFNSELRDAPFYVHQPITGYHEVLIETRDHGKEPYESGIREMKNVVDLYISRYEELMSKKDVKYVSIFKNRGEVAGASISHPHSQVTALPVVPQRIKWEMEGIKNGCTFCRIVETESMGQRFIHDNGSFVAICPYAPKFQYEVWILPKRHMRDILAMNENERNDLAEIMGTILNSMERLLGGFPYNYAFHQAPKGKDFHFHVEIYPRLGVLAGLELGSNIYVNSVPPENAAMDIKNNL
jgi:UDPglucose--hexose-1-phosphate uridylyltransferase